MLYRRLSHEFEAYSRNHHDELRFLLGNGTCKKAANSYSEGISGNNRARQLPATMSCIVARWSLRCETEQISNYKLFQRSLPPVYTRSLFSGVTDQESSSRGCGQKTGKEDCKMNRITKNIIAVLAVFLAVQLSAPVFAQQPGDIHVYVLEEVAVPGHLLTPGDYVFRHVSFANPHTFGIWSSDGSEFVGFFHVIPVQQLDNRQDTEIDVSDADGAGVRRIEAWYWRGERYGYQFIYSKQDIERLDRLAQAQRALNTSSAGQQ